jgi:dihydroxy-acid dehydratase
MIEFDIPNRTMTVEITPDEMAARLATWTAPAPHFKSGVFRKYADSVSSAAMGAVTN